jgi:hypothetical protein
MMVARELFEREEISLGKLLEIGRILKGIF